MKRFFKLIKPFSVANTILETGKVIDSYQSVKLIFIDVDNTILSYKENEISCRVKQWLDTMSVHKMIVIITNNNKKRVEQIAGLNRFKCVCNAAKPFPFAYSNTLKKYNILRKESIIIGDQLFDDVLGGNLAGIKTILIKPIEKEMTYRMRVKRYFESILLKYMEII
ncbi:MAG: HAD-IIIA family hydrolase [Clostridiales bacterium]|nr:HAD-IIIA family hydrolase [Clostridiales bacterium]